MLHDFAAAAIHTLPGEIIRYNDAHPDDNKPKGTQVTNKEIIQELYQNFASGDVPAVTARFDDDITWTEAGGKYAWSHKDSGEPCEVKMARVWTLAEGKATAFLQHVDSDQRP